MLNSLSESKDRKVLIFKMGEYFPAEKGTKVFVDKGNRERVFNRLYAEFKDVADFIIYLPEGDYFRWQTISPDTWTCNEMSYSIVTGGNDFIGIKFKNIEYDYLKSPLIHKNEIK